MLLARLRTGEDEPAPEPVGNPFGMSSAIAPMAWTETCWLWTFAASPSGWKATPPANPTPFSTTASAAVTRAWVRSISAFLRRASRTSRATSGLQPSSKRWRPILLSSPPPGSPTTSAAGPLTHGFMAALGRSPSVNRSATDRWSFLKFLPEAASTSCSATGSRGVLE